MKVEPICYVFGYGSLMYPHGINGRGMKHRYTWDDLCVADLSGYKRGMYAGYSDLLYYGLLPDEKASDRSILHVSSPVLGVIVPIFSEEDFIALKKSEGVSPKYKDPMYEVTDVTSLVYAYALIVPKPIFAFTNKRDKSLDGGHAVPWYVANVWCGIRPWGCANTMRMEASGIRRPTRFWKVFRHYYTIRKKFRRKRK